MEDIELGLFEEDRRVFLGWDRPLLPLVVEWLWERREALPGTLVVVPTAQSGRRLREALAEAGGCLAPRVVTPGYFMRAEGAAPEAVELLAWVEVLEGVRDWESFTAAFPSAPGVGEGSGWALGLARSLAGVRTSLQENALTFGAAAKRMAGTVDGERWANLAALEARVEALLESWGMTGVNESLARGRYDWPGGLEQVVVAGVADLPKAVERVLEKAPVPVTVLVAGVDGADFDEWGRPAEDWLTRTLGWPGDDAVHLVADSRQQAEEAMRVVAEAGTDSSDLVLGSADEETSGELVRVFGRAGWPVFDPGKRVVSPLAAWLSAWRNYLKTPGVAEAVDLAGFAQSGVLVRGRRAQRVTALSKARDAWLVRTLADVERARARVAELVEETRRADGDRRLKWRERELEEIEVAQETLELLEGRRGMFLRDGLHAGMDRLLGVVDPDGESGVREWIEATEAVAGHVNRDVVFWLDLLLAGIGRVAEPAPEDRVADVLGWVELLYEPGPHLVVCGMNEGMVPVRESTDAWLPEGARRLLGLTTGETRAARDAYLLAAMLEARKNDGRVDLLLAKSTGDGDVLTPSRLLLAAEGGELARRVTMLFREVEPPESGLAWTMDGSWRWRPGVGAARTRLSVTAFSDYLACPFRFYLKQVGRMWQPEPERVEWNARDFGNVAHLVVERWARDPEAREFSKTEAIEEWVHAALEAVVRERFGDAPPLAVRIQQEAMRQRLSWFARVQACERAAGWHVTEVEKNFAFDLDGVEVRGQVDRIEMHDDGRKRILDYKTTAKAADVEKAHRTRIVASTRWPAHLEGVEEVRTADGKMRWTNLQVALYSEAIEDVDEVGYFALGATEGDVKLVLWSGFDAADRESAVRCARWVVGQVKEGVFWPAAERVTYDDYACLALGRSLEETMHVGMVNGDGKGGGDE